MRKLLTLSTGLLFLLLLSVPALAADISVSASLNATHVQVGESLTLTVSVVGESGAAAPDVTIPDCQVRYYGPSSQVSIVNGRRSEQVSHLYQVTPLKVGTIEVPAIEVKAQGKTYRTQPLALTVSERGQSVTGTAGGALQDYVFLEVIPARQQMYVNEEIPLTVNLWVRRELDLRNIHFPEVPLTNFVVQQFPQPEQKTEYLKGNYYSVFSFRTTIRPLIAGAFKLSDISLATDVLVPQNNRGFGFFNDYQTYSANLVAPEMPLEVLDFPAASKPAGFSGTVGKFNMNVTVNPEEVKVGEPVTIKTSITGTGSFSTVSAPVIAEDSRFKYYDPQVVNNPTGENVGRQEKVFEQVIIPTSEATAVPVISFSYFDPEKGSYVTLTEESIPLTVTGSGIASPQVEDYRAEAKTQEVLGQGILYIKANPGRFAAVGRSSLLTPGLLGYNIALLLALGGGFIWRRKLSRETPDERRWKVVRAQTQQYLQESEELLKTGKTTEFYNTLYLAVQNYLKERFQITITGISDYEAAHLQKAGLPVEMLEQIREFFRDMDMKRFAGSFDGGQDLHQMLLRARKLIAAVEQGEVA